MPGYVTGPNNELLYDGTWHYTYDADGNVNTKTSDAGEKWIYGWDARDELTQIEHFNATGALVLTEDYHYDALGNRISETIDSDGAGPDLAQTTKFVLDGFNPAKGTPIGNENWDVWADVNADGSLKTQYFRGDMVDEILGRVDSGTGARWTLTDYIGSIRLVLDVGGNVLDAADYDPFGNIISQTDPSELGRYTAFGREWDVEAQMQYDRERYYIPSIGRWASQDPMAFQAGDSNLYRYVNNAPTNATDPSGLFLNPQVMQEAKRIADALPQQAGLGKLAILGIGAAIAAGAGLLAGGAKDDAQEIGRIQGEMMLRREDDLPVPRQAAPQKAANPAAAGGANRPPNPPVEVAPAPDPNERRITFGHGARHLEGSGLNQADVERNCARNSSISRLRYPFWLDSSKWTMDPISGFRSARRLDQHRNICSSTPESVERESAMIQELFRELNTKERRLIEKLLSPTFPGRDELSKQLESAKVRKIDENGSLEFQVLSPVRAWNVKYVIPTEGEYEDPDGITVHVLLHLLNDEAKELEFFREDGHPVRGWPDCDAIRIFAPQ